MSDTLYTELGVNPGADADTIKDAFRRWAQATHPDKGGAPGDFERVKEAYEVLSDPARRATYDETGATTAQPSVEQEADKLLADMFRQYLGSGEVAEPLASMRTMLKGIKGDQAKQLKATDAQLKLVGKLQGKLRRVTPGAQTLILVLKAKMHSLQDSKLAVERTLKVIEAMFKALSEWEVVGWEPEKPPESDPKDELLTLLESMNQGRPYGHRF